MIPFMIIVTGTISIAEQDRASFLEGWEVMRAATLREDGCRAYDVWQSRSNENDFRLYEEWDSMEHLQAHFDSEHMATWQAVSADFSAERDISIIETASVQSL